MRPLLIDLFCGEGGAAKGYAEAGFEVIGIDLVKQPRYPYTFIKGDALDPDHRLFRMAAAIHASPPCQFGTEMNNDKSRHLNLIPATRKLLQASGLPYVIENVRAVRPHLINPISLFGTMFGNYMTTSAGRRYDLSRERLFESSWRLPAPRYGTTTERPIANVIGGHLRCRDAAHRTGGKSGRTVDFPGEDRPALARQLMGMPWATMQGMSEGVPPSYTCWVGDMLMAHLNKEPAWKWRETREYMRAML